MTKTKYEFKNIIKDEENNLTGTIYFSYDNKIHQHDFTYDTEEEQLMCVEYGWRIPGLDKLWNGIEKHIRKYDKQLQKECKLNSREILTSQQQEKFAV